MTFSPKKRVLFICTHNSSRSQMAEGLLKAKFGVLYDVSSAGTNPTRINPYAVHVLKEIGIDISGRTDYPSGISRSFYSAGNRGREAGCIQEFS